MIHATVEVVKSLKNAMESEHDATFNAFDVHALNCMMQRHSVRAFTPQPVEPAVLTQILECASRAPSGTNTQPWKVWILEGEIQKTLVNKVCAIHTDAQALAQYPLPADYYPKQWFSPYTERRRENGKDLYGLLEIGKDDKDSMHAQHERNFRFFDAPIGLMFTIDSRLGKGSWLDTGMFIQTLMLAAQAHGISTCAQASWNRFAGVILPHLGAPPNEVLVCGMAMGYADTQAKINQLKTPRAPMTDWVFYP